MSDKERAIKEAKKNKRARYIELCKIASQVCDLLEDSGVEQHEGCTLRRLAEDMWDRGGTLDIASMNASPVIQ